MNVDITIDEFTFCIVDRETEKIFITQMDKIVPQKSDYKGWNFDWSIPIENGYDIHALKISGDTIIQGMIATKIEDYNKSVHVDIIETAPHNLGKTGKYKGIGAHLFAFACKQAYDNGYNYIYFDAKTDLIEYYKEKLGALQIGSSQKMLIEGKCFSDLLNTYYGGK